jgi:hypothetical protein
MALLKASEVKKLVKEAGKRTGADFMPALDAAIHKKIQDCITFHNAGKKTLDASVVHFVFK